VKKKPQSPISGLPAFIIFLGILLSGCSNIYGPARLGMNTHVLQKPIITDQEKTDTSATYAGIEYTNSTYLSNEANRLDNDLVHAFSARAHKSFVKNKVAYSFGGAFTFGNRTFPIDSVNNSTIASGWYSHYSFTAFAELAVPLIKLSNVNFYPAKFGFFYTYEAGSSMDFIRNEAFRNNSIDAYINPHMPSLVLSHELMINLQDNLVVGVDLGQIFTLNARQNSYDGSLDTYSNVFYSLRGSLFLTAERYSLTFTGIAGLHSGLNIGLTARLGRL
jgi:hypothetical protein